MFHAFFFPNNRCLCGGTTLMEIAGENDTCPKLSTTSDPSISVVHCTPWDISSSICNSAGKQLGVPKTGVSISGYF